MRVKKYSPGRFSALVLPLLILFLLGAARPCRALAEGFSESLCGATGWGTTELYVYGTDADSSRIVTIGAKEPFQILERYKDNLLQIEYNGVVGYVNKENVLINLPDVEPDILYNLTNASGSVFTSTTQRGDANQRLSLYGSQIYYNGGTSAYYDGDAYRETAASRAGRIWNQKLGRYEFAVPVLFTAAEKISVARELAVSDGCDLKIYDAYRPHTATKLMNDSFNSLYSQTGGALKLGGYDTGFFVASSLSSHNIGCAIDVTLVRGAEEARMPTKMHVLSGDAALLSYSPSGRTASALSGQPYRYYAENFADTMTEDAKKLCQYMISAGMTGLGSEWWHYQDETGYSLNSGFYTNLASWYPCQLYANVDAEGAAEVPARRADAVYQLWAAAGFPDASGDISFTDVTEYDFYYNAVRWAVSEGLISGSSPTSFSPYDTITRAGFLELLYRYCGSPQMEGLDGPVFGDVSVNAWYHSAVQWAAGLGIAEEASGSFHPSGVLTQWQMHTFLQRASESGVRLNRNYL